MAFNMFDLLKSLPPSVPGCVELKFNSSNIWPKFNWLPLCSSERTKDSSVFDNIDSLCLAATSVLDCVSPTVAPQDLQINFELRVWTGHVQRMCIIFPGAVNWFICVQKLYKVIDWLWTRPATTTFILWQLYCVRVPRPELLHGKWGIISRPQFI